MRSHKTNSSCGQATLSKSQSRGTSYGSQELSTGNMLESEDENDDVMVNTRDWLHYWHNLGII